jgi:ferric-dicitrate binding protein FerR (iron transport regulator)
MSIILKTGNSKPKNPNRYYGLVLICFLALPLSETLAQTLQIGIAKNAIGTLLVVRSDGIEDRLRGEGSLQLFEGDVLKTEANGQALIILRDGTQVALNENTTMKMLARWEKTKGSTPILRMNRGEVWLKTERGPKPVEVETPVAVAATQDAELNLKVLPDGQSVLTTINGLVEFGTAFGTCPIRTGSISYGNRGARCTKPEATDPKAATSWMKVVGK